MTHSTTNGRDNTKMAQLGEVSRIGGWRGSPNSIAALLRCQVPYQDQRKCKRCRQMAMRGRDYCRIHGGPGRRFAEDHGGRIESRVLRRLERLGLLPLDLHGAAGVAGPYDGPPGRPGADAPRLAASLGQAKPGTALLGAGATEGDGDGAPGASGEGGVDTMGRTRVKERKARTGQTVPGPGRDHKMSGGARDMGLSRGL